VSLVCTDTLLSVGLDGPQNKKTVNKDKPIKKIFFIRWMSKNIKRYSL
jgi:hypothetical protein